MTKEVVHDRLDRLESLVEHQGKIIDQLTATTLSGDTTEQGGTDMEAPPPVLTSGGQPTKVIGSIPDDDGIGVFGEATGSGTTCGVRGEAPNGYGLSTPHDANVGGTLEAAASNTDLLGDNGSGDVTLDSSLDTNGNGITSNGTVSINDGVSVTGSVDASTGYRGNVGATAHLSFDQTLSDSTQTKVEFDAIRNADDRNEFDTSNNKFVCAHDGDYHIEVQIRWKDSFSNGDRISFDVNAGGWVHIRSTRGVGGSSVKPSMHASKTVKNLSQGDEILVNAKHFGGEDKSLDGKWLTTYISVTQVG
jgi:hypothetical protein